MDYVKIKETPGFVRDSSNRAIVNVNNSGLEAYKLKRKREKEIDQTVDDINTLKTEVAEIKSLLLQLLKNKE